MIERHGAADVASMFDAEGVDLRTRERFAAFMRERKAAGARDFQLAMRLDLLGRARWRFSYFDSDGRERSLIATYPERLIEAFERIERWRALFRAEEAPR